MPWLSPSGAKGRGSPGKPVVFSVQWEPEDTEFQYQQGDAVVAAAEPMKSAIRHKGSTAKIKVVSSDLLYGGSNRKLLPICGAALPLQRNRARKVPLRHSQKFLSS